MPLTTWRRSLLPRLALALLVAAGFVAAPVQAGDPPVLPGGVVGGGPVVTDHVTAELIAATTTVQPGTEALIGIKLVIDEHWHVYWKNPGDSGTEVEVLEWTLPELWEAGPIVWPAPIRLPQSGLVNFGHEGTALFVVRLKIPADAPEGPVTIQASVGWLVCEVGECLPGDAELALTLHVSRAEPKPGAHQALFEATQAQWPRALPEGAALRARPAGRAIELEAKGPGPWSAPATTLFFFPELERVEKKLLTVVEPSAPQTVQRAQGAVTLTLQMPAKRKAFPARLVGVLVVEDDKGRHPYAVDLPVTGDDGAPAGAPAEERAPFLLLLLGAFVGGLILNIMPCVLPVLSIKILGFVSQADEQPARVRRHGYAFGLGVLASFWFLAAIVLAVRAGGEELGWGFQLQNPVVVAAMAVLMFAVGVNLAGVYEFGLGVQTLAGDAATKIHTHGYASSFWSGALATVIATPCTAPMMGPAIGYAMIAPAHQSLLLFTTLGLGMAAPYVLLTMSPRLLKKMPRPGPWMDHFKHALAFPMFAAVIWLVTVFAEQTEGVASMTWMLLGLLVLGVGLWIYGTWGTPSTPPKKRWIVGYGLTALAALACFFMLRTAANPHEGHIVWEPWSPERIAQARAEGRPVFVDFTAAWCVSCIAQEKAFIEVDDVKQAIKDHNVLMLKADWTKKGDDIRRGLAEFGRSSVPLYLMYSPDLSRPANVLPQIPSSSSQIVDAMREAAVKLPPPPTAPR